MSKTKLVLMCGLVILLIVALLLSGACPKPTQVGKVIKIGAPGPLSGMGAPWGLPEDRGLRMLVDEVNAAGGLTIGGETYTFVVVSADTQFTVEGAAAAAQKLAQMDKVKYAVGGIDKHESLSLQAVFEPAGVIHFHDGWGYDLVSPEAPHSFRIASEPHAQTPAIHSWLLENYPNLKRWVLVGYDTPGIHEVNAQISSYLPGMGLEIAAEEYYPWDQVEFYPLITKILELGVDAIEVTGATPPQMGLFLKQAREKGFDGPIFLAAPVEAAPLVDVAGVEAVEGFMCVMVITSGPMATPEARAFREAYIDSYGVWESNILDISVAFQIIKEAMKKADSVEVEEVLPVLHAGGPFDTILGPVLIGGEELFGVPCECFQTLGVHQMKNGELVPVGALTAEYVVEQLKKNLP